MLCFHGTTAKGLKAILSGCNHKPNNPWSCSDQDGQMYVIPLDKLIKQFDLEDDDLDYQTERGLREVLQSAQIQAAISQEGDLYSLLLDIPEELLEDDLSCDGMSDTASCLYITEFNKSFIKEVHTTDDFSKWYLPFIIAGLLNNQYFNQYSIDDDLLKVAEALQGKETYLEELYEMELYPVTEQYL